MIRNKLAELLAERKLKISRVAAQLPNLSRNTITSTASNKGKMIQLETINTLCQYLDISPSDFFEYLPFDVSCDVSISKNETSCSDENMENIQIKQHSIEFDFFIKLETVNDKPIIFEYTGSNLSQNYWGKEIIFKLNKNDTSDFDNVWNHKITPGFQAVIWNDFKQKVADTINDSMTRKFSSHSNPFKFQIRSNSIRLSTDFYDDVFNIDF